VVDDDGLVGDVLDVGHVVTGEEDGAPELLVEVDQQLAKLLFGHEIETDRRFVEEQQIGGVEQASRQLASHPLAERQGSAGLVEQLGGVESLGQLGHPPGHRGAVETVDGGQHLEPDVGR